MQILSFLLTALLFVGDGLARSPLPHNKDIRERASRSTHANPKKSPPNYGGPSKGKIIAQNANTTKFAVDGTALPDVDWDVGESYAGLLPISDKRNVSELFFWFFPSDNPLATDEILIWLNGGPGCSSLEGFLQENGPIMWQYGTNKPVQNPYTWNNLTNVVWVEQPAGTGFSPTHGTPRATNMDEVVDQFLGFWKNFVDTFSLHGRKIYITGESYAGFYVPYIADAMHNMTDTKYFGINSTMMYDPTTSYAVLQAEVPVSQYIEYWKPLFWLNDTFANDIHARADKCGYTAFADTAMTFPPKGKLPTPPNVGLTDPSCNVWGDVFHAALEINPCFDEYQMATTCPLLWDVLGFPGSFPYEPAPPVYFARHDVQKVIHAPIGPWAECSNGVLDTNTSPPSGLSVLPNLIEKNTRTIIGHGMLDFLYPFFGTIYMIQNMTWNGAQGFSSPPSEWSDFYVPYHSELNLGTIAGAGSFGQWHTERGFTFVTTALSGHMIPQYAPSAAYRQLEFLLGRISDLGERSDFTTQHGNFGNHFDFAASNLTRRIA